MFFALPSLVLGVVLLLIVLGSCAIGVLVARRLRGRHDTWREPIGVVQAALLGFVALILAFGLTMAVGRYETRRVELVTEANAIGTTYLRAQTLSEPVRSQSLGLLKRYTDVEIRLSATRPGSAAARRDVADGGAIQRQLWALAADSLREAPQASAPRLYVDSLNSMIDSQTSRVAALSNRVPTPVLVLEVVGAAVALGLLGLYLTVLGRGMLPIMLAAVFVSLLLLVTFDLDRPTRGLITVPYTALLDLRASMDLPPAAGGG
ncbi:hypothetical protein OG555_11880 [Kribbella sp. NBC_01484]|uniref:bestrophin-like domain n=1 Tax=Kribbella sp. NBC_01484 TaxID=2903579 RepID=UPI002E2F200C|nr:hypothetical protein [Kribbella sp. NBC_01484]